MSSRYAYLSQTNCWADPLLLTGRLEMLLQGLWQRHLAQCASHCDAQAFLLGCLGFGECDFFDCWRSAFTIILVGWLLDPTRHVQKRRRLHGPASLLGYFFFRVAILAVQSHMVLVTLWVAREHLVLDAATLTSDPILTFAINTLGWHVGVRIFLPELVFGEIICSPLSNLRNQFHLVSRFACW